MKEILVPAIVYTDVRNKPFNADMKPAEVERILQARGITNTPRIYLSEDGGKRIPQEVKDGQRVIMDILVPVHEMLEGVKYRLN